MARTRKPKEPLDKDKLKKKPKGGRKRAISKTEKIEAYKKKATTFQDTVIYEDGSIGINEVYDPDVHINKVLQLMQQGVRKQELCIEMGISPIAIDNWEINHPDFASAIAVGRILCRAWWMAQGRRSIHTPFFNTRLFEFNMVNSFDWVRKIDTDTLMDKFKDLNAGKDEGEIDYSEMDVELLDKLNEYVKNDNRKEQEPAE